MKSLRYLSILLVLFGVTGVTSPIDASSKSVVVVNNTPYTLTEFYASDSDSSTSTWDTTNNLVAGQSVAPGQRITINISDGTSDCAYDLMGVLYGAAQYAYQYHVDACDGGSWTITYTP